MTKPIIVVGKYANGQYVIDQTNLTGGVLPVRGGVMHFPTEFSLMLDEKLNILLPEKGSARIAVIMHEEVDAMKFLCETVKQVNLFELGLTKRRKERIREALQRTIDLAVGNVIELFSIDFIKEQIEKYQ